MDEHDEAFDEIGYELSPPATADPRTESILIRTVSRLPDDVKEFAVGRCVFLYAPSGSVQVRRGHIGCAHWTVLQVSRESEAILKEEIDGWWRDFRETPDPERWKSLVVLGDLDDTDESSAMRRIAFGIAWALSGGSDEGLLKEGDVPGLDALVDSWGFVIKR